MFGLGKGRKAAKVTPVTLQEQIDALEGTFRSLKLEWTDVYERLYKIAGRIDAGKRWGQPNPPSQPTGKEENVPENGSEDAFPAPNEPPAPVRVKSRKDMLDQWTR